MWQVNKTDNTHGIRNFSCPPERPALFHLRLSYSSISIEASICLLRIHTLSSMQKLMAKLLLARIFPNLPAMEARLVDAIVTAGIRRTLDGRFGMKVRTLYRSLSNKGVAIFG